MPPLARAYYQANVSEFLTDSLDVILGRLSFQSGFDILTSQRSAWVEQIQILKVALRGIRGRLLLEYTVPRVGSRVDAVVLSGALVIVIEFKVGARRAEAADLNQAWDYALDLKNFHKASHSAAVLPILVPTDAPSVSATVSFASADGVFAPVVASPAELGALLTSALLTATGEPIDTSAWTEAPYDPTPNIIEAARVLYAHHSVADISRSDAGAQNLTVTSTCIENIIDEARSACRKVVIFVTGVPGAGKTLVGLNIATARYDASSATHAVFLSGNGPLVAVLRAALTRDAIQNLGVNVTKQQKADAKQKVKAFIQNVHHFRDEALATSTPPTDHVVIFDEAQRAWDLDMTRDFMKRKKGQPGFAQSEPEFLLSYLDRHKDWAVVICLVGGGQELNRGEAGISAWLDAVNARFRHWRVYVSSELTDSEYAAGHALERLSQHGDVQQDMALHLSVSMRSFRAENVSSLVKALLDVDPQGARLYLASLAHRYEVALTRDLEAARQWLRTRARGTERFGLVVSSGAQRLKPLAIDVRVNVDPIHWFLDSRDDPRSSFYLEDAATEFQVQGLELDWVCITWDGDLRYNDTEPGWQYHSFRGNKWQKVSKASRQRYLLNAYRVLLTRARQGMVICVPSGDTADQTRNPEFYDGTFNYLAGMGIPILS